MGGCSLIRVCSLIRSNTVFRLTRDTRRSFRLIHGSNAPDCSSIIRMEFLSGFVVGAHITDYLVQSSEFAERKWRHVRIALNYSLYSFSDLVAPPTVTL